jgi:monoamine oxidase
MPSLYARLARRFAPPPVPTDTSRRDLLKSTAAAGAALLLSNCVAKPSDFSRGPLPGKRRIVVIGAGFAGLAAAHELTAAGYEVAVLESRARIGGRVLSFKDMVPGKIVEGGGELIGSNHATWIAYAAQFKLDFRQIEEDKTLDSPLMLEGRLLPNAEAEALYKELDAAVITLNEAARAVDAERPWLMPNAVQLDAVSMNDWLAQTNLSKLAKRAFRAEQEANQGVPLERQGYLAFLTMLKAGGVEKYWTDSETCRCAQGNHALADAFAARLGKRIHLQSSVVSIVVGSDQVMVTTDAGGRFLAEDVILTTPPSTWSTLRFTPELPATLKPQMGPAVKYLSAVKRRFWIDSKLAPDSMTDGDLAMTWEGTANQPGDNGAELTVFSGGPSAEHLRTRPTVDRNAYCQSELARLYPGYADNVISTRFMDWPSDPNTLAGYTFLAPRQVTTIAPTLYEGLGKLHFAGEFASIGFPGYMEGALRSGASVARRLLARDTALLPAPK